MAPQASGASQFMRRESEVREYSFSHISDLLKLDDEHIEAFCSELPEAIRSAQNMVELFTVAAEALSGKDRADTDIDLSIMLPVMTWKPDGQQDVTCRLKHGDIHLGDIVFSHEDEA